MSEKLDEVRTLAIQLYNANLRRKKKHGPYIWGRPTEWRDLPSESVEVWDAVALEAIKRLRKAKELGGEK